MAPTQQQSAAIEVQETILKWEARLEDMGPLRAISEYQEHLDQAPESAPSKPLLHGFILGLEVASISSGPSPGSLKS